MTIHSSLISGYSLHIKKKIESGICLFEEKLLMKINMVTY